MAASPHPETRRKIRALRRLLARTRARKLGITAAAGMAAAASVLIGGLAAEAVLDRLAALPWPARACLTIPAALAACCLAWREVLRPLLRRPEDYAVACEIERSLPVFRTRLIASIQFGAEADGPANSFVRALIGETAALAAASDFRRVVETGRLKRSLRILLLVVAAAGGLAWAGRDCAGVLLRRVLLWPVPFPSRTHILSVRSPGKIALGDDLKITVEGAGVLPAAGTVAVRSGAGKADEYKLERDSPGGAEYQATVPNVQEAMNFRVTLNDATSEEQRVAVVAPPAVLALECRQVFPAYTRLPPRVRGTSDLELLAGSTLEVGARSSAILSGATLHLVGPEKDLPMAANGSDARASIAIPSQGLDGFSIHLVDRDGIASRNGVTYKIDILADRPPTLKLTEPESSSELVTAAGTERIAFEAQDDFGVAKGVLHYTVNAGPEKTVAFDPGSVLPLHWARSYDWQMQPLTAATGTVIEYWVEALDANNLTGPGRAETERRKLTIVTDGQKRAELAGRMAEAESGLEALDRNQAELTEIFGSPALPKAKEHTRP